MSSPLGLWDALLVVSAALRGVPGPWGFPWEILLCAAMALFIVKSRSRLRRGAELAERCSARAEVYRKVREKTGLTAQAYEALQTPMVVARAPTLQILCLEALNKNPNGSSLEDMKDFLEKVQKSEPSSQLSFHGLMMARLQGQIRSLGVMSESHQLQVTEAKNILKASQDKVRHLQEQLRDGMNENGHLQQSLKQLSQEMEGWRHRIQGLKERKDLLERSNAQMQRLLGDNRSHLKSLVETTLKTRHSPDLWREGHVEMSNLKVGEKREAESERPPGGLSEADLKGLIHAVNLKVSFKRKKKEKEEISRKLYEENQINEERVGQIKCLQTEQASLKSENAQLGREVQKLRLKLEMLPELHQEQVKQLPRKSAEEKTRHLEMERRRPQVYRRLDYASQKSSLYRKMAEDIEGELGRATFSYRSELLSQERRDRERGAEALSTERVLHELRKDNDHIRQVLASLQLKLQPFPSGAFVPAVPYAAQGRLAGSGYPLGQELPQEAGRSRWEGSGFQAHMQV